MAQREIFPVGAQGNGSTLEWIVRLPAASGDAATHTGLVLLAHGCRQSPRVWFAPSDGCAACVSPRPEERCIALHLHAAGYALVAASNPLHGTKGCWETADVPIVAGRLRAWQKQHENKALRGAPLFVLGPSSGGFFATQFARHVRDVRAISIQVSVPSMTDVRGLPPAVEIILMSRDAGKVRDASALQRALGKRIRVRIAKPQPVYDAYFAEGIPGLSLIASRAVRAELVRAGYVEEVTSLVRTHPSRGQWAAAVRRGLSGQPKATSLPLASLQVALDSIFARLDLAYAYHASTCAFINDTLDFFRTAA